MSHKTLESRISTKLKIYLKKIYACINIKCQIFWKPKHCPLKFSVISHNHKANEKKNNIYISFHFNKIDKMKSS